MSTCYLRIGSDVLAEATKYYSVAAACGAFAVVARDLYRFGQSIDADIHIAPNRESLVEYPDFVLSTGPKGGIVKERA